VVEYVLTIISVLIPNKKKNNWLKLSRKECSHTLRALMIPFILIFFLTEPLPIRHHRGLENES
jgi:hypothetical protein